MAIVIDCNRCCLFQHHDNAFDLIKARQLGVDILTTAAHYGFT